MPITLFFIALLSILLNTTAQLFIKAGTASIPISISTSSIYNLTISILKIIFEIHIFSGLLCYVLSVEIWIYVLSKIEVSIAYPMSSLGYVVNLVLAYLIFQEPISIYKIIGVLLICAGVFFILK